MDVVLTSPGARNFLDVVVRLTRLLPSETKSAAIALAIPVITNIGDVVATITAIFRFVDDEGNLLVDEYGNTFFEQ